jgi:glyoxylase-like metal-dependent hydrolase (beta-lactamase superfamily II)
MKTSSHGDHLTKITKGGFVNAFLVREDDGLTLVDTMLPRSEKGILEAAEALGAPIVRIALTHAHQDHVGSVDALKRALPDAEVLITARDARFLTGEKNFDPSETEGGKVRGAYVKIETQPTGMLNAGDRVGSLEVVPSPGHTPGHVAFLDTRDRTLIAGDAYLTLGGIGVPSHANLPFPLVWMGTLNRAQALESAKALRALDPSRLAVGHGRVIDSPAAAMDKAIAKAS